MKTELRENSTFMRYYEIWRANPASVVFAPLAELLILHDCYEEAIGVCKKGLGKNPDLISGRLALAKAYIGVSNYSRAREEAQLILNKYPNHPGAVEILDISSKDSDQTGPKTVPVFETTGHPFEGDLLPSTLDPSDDIRWNTVTMAEIFAAQGNITVARKIYRNVLKKDPSNIRAQNGLEKLNNTEEEVV